MSIRRRKEVEIPLTIDMNVLRAILDHKKRIKRLNITTGNGKNFSGYVAGIEVDNDSGTMLLKLFDLIEGHDG